MKNRQKMTAKQLNKVKHLAAFAKKARTRKKNVKRLNDFYKVEIETRGYHYVHDMACLAPVIVCGGNWAAGAYAGSSNFRGGGK